MVSFFCCVPREPKPLAAFWLKQLSCLATLLHGCNRLHLQDVVLHRIAIAKLPLEPLCDATFACAAEVKTTRLGCYSQPAVLIS